MAEGYKEQADQALEMAEAIAPDDVEQRNTFTLVISDDGEQFDVQWSIDPPWDGQSAPPPSYYVGGLVVNFLKDLLEEPDEGPTLVE